MTEALIGDLAKIGSLRVISRTSVMQYKGVRKPLPEIAQELDVDGVIEGTVMRAADRVRITVQLIHARSDTHLWNDRYDRELSDVLALQSDVARAVAEQIRVELTLEDQARLAGSRRVDPEAHEAYLRGLHLLWTQTRCATSCPQCGTELPSAAKFCHECGRSTVEAQPERDPRAYTPKYLADKILQSKSALEGERKQVTVLFADVRGSMELAEQVGSEEWHRVLDRFFQILSEGVHRFEGTVNQYTGDGIMALFGAPIAHEDHAQRACYAALALHYDLAVQAREVKREHGLTPAASV